VVERIILIKHRPYRDILWDVLWALKERWPKGEPYSALINEAEDAFYGFKMPSSDAKD
jgi:hypothetical protein